MSPLWIEEDDGTCSSPPIRVSSLSGTTSNVCRVSLMPAFAFIWSAAGVTGRLVWAPWAPVLPFSSSSTQEPWKHKSQEGGRKGNEASCCCFCFFKQLIVQRHTPASYWNSWPTFPAPLTLCIQMNWPLCAASMKACISLCHCPTNSLHIFFSRQEGVM